MLNKQAIISKLTERQYPKNEYWIIAGAGLVMHGVTSETNDIDLGCSALLADLLIKNGVAYQTRADGTRKMIVDSDIEVVEDRFVDSFVEIDGFLVASLDCIRKKKLEINRPKDLADVERIDEFLKRR